MQTDQIKHVVAISGGKDSTALAIVLAEREPRDYTYLITPTGNELPEMQEHWNRLECILGKPLTRVSRQTLGDLIKIQNALPSHRMRWCTRILKIEPCLQWIRENGPAVLYVGLRADEEERKGIYSADVTTRFPFQEWGWVEEDILSFLFEREITIPYRTDCAHCYDQRLSQWRRLWQTNRGIYNEGIAFEDLTGHTFRSPSRDTWPASLRELAVEFERGRIPRGTDDQMHLWDNADQGRCRVCTM